MPRSSSKFLSADDVAAAALHAHLHVQLAALGHRRDVRIRLEDLDVGVGLDVARLDFAGLVDAQVERLGGVDVHLQRNLLEVQDDVGRVLDHAGDRRELVEHAVDLHRGHRRALDRREQHAPHRVADRRAEPALERLRVEPAEPVGQRFTLELQPLRPLKTFPEHVAVLPFASRAQHGRAPDLRVRPPPPAAGLGWLRAEGYVSTPNCQLPVAKSK